MVRKTIAVVSILSTRTNEEEILFSLQKLLTLFLQRQFIIYVTIGGMGVLVDFLLYRSLLQQQMFYLTANIISYASGTLISFILNRQYNFKQKEKTLHRLITFYLVAGVGFIISSLLLVLLVDSMHLPPLVAKGATLVVVVVLQFGLNKKLTFAPVKNRVS